MSLKNDPDWVFLGKVGVDSGQLMVCDPCYIDSHWKKEDYKDDKTKPKHQFSYKAVCHKTLEDGSGQIERGLAVAFETGGDGVFLVYGRKGRGGHIVEVRVVMDEEPENDEEK